MSVIVRGMNMPKTCAECPFKQAKPSNISINYVCMFTDTTVMRGSNMTSDANSEILRLPNCPLFEVRAWEQ